MRAALGTLALAAVVLAGLGGAASSSEAATARSGNFLILSMHEDRFRNYDFNTREVRANNVDWAVALMFWNNATINRVKGILGNEYDQSGSTQHGRMNENVNTQPYIWDDDGGRKTTACPGLPTQPREARHYRVYAPSNDDRMYNMSWRYWVFGTAHYDIDECSFSNPAWFGYSETAEGWIAYRWRQNGYSVTEDWSSFRNAEPYRVEGDHIWDNNGYASAFYVP